MSSLKIQGNASGAGITTLQSANTASSATFTLPASDGTANQVLKTDGSGNLGFATASVGDVVGPASATDNVLALYDGATGKLLKNSTITASGVAGSVGFIGAPQQSGGASAYTAALSDQGKHIVFTSGSTATLTIPTNASVAFPIGTVILVVNDNSGNLTISGAGVTFQLANGATGNRTVATKGLATCLKTGTDTWYVSGAGVT
jgi:hypothetical protein